jgi:hypothetical protein
VSLLTKIGRQNALRSARRSTAAGDYARAIATLERANGREVDTQLERAIVDALLLMGQEEPADVAAERSPEGQACALELAGPIPEIEFSQLDEAVLRHAIDEYGYLVVRGMLAPDQARMVRQCIDDTFEAQTRVAAGDPGEQASPWHYRSEHFSPGKHRIYSKRTEQQRARRSGSTRVIESPRSVVRLLDLYRERGVESLIRGYFREPAMIAARKWVFRLVEPIAMRKENIGGGWHQDGQFMGESVNALNMWVALSECGQGTQAPGIALLPRRFREIIEYGTRGANLAWVVGSDLVEELAEDAPVVSPYFAPGDALFFDHFSLHRSGHGPFQDKPRYALESWFYARSGTQGNLSIPLLPG